MKQKNAKGCIIEKRKVNPQMRIAGTLALALCVGSTQLAFAQRTRDDRRENRATQREGRNAEIQNMSPEQRQQYFQQRQQARWNAMSPQERQQMQQRMQERRQQMRQQQLNSQMGAAGVKDPEIMDLIRQFMDEQERIRQPLLEMAKKIAAGLPSRNVSDEKISTDLEAFRKAVEEDKTRYEKALKQLDTAISYSNNPKLEAFLTLIGVLGNESQAVGGPNAIFADQMAAGGFGGFGGGGFGGGGFGGGPGGGGGGFGGGPGGGGNGGGRGGGGFGGGN